MVDEVDSAANDQVFLDFLAQLRGYYIDRDASPMFQSVILAGVYDIKNLVSVEFKIDMSFSTKKISGMLQEYEDDYATGMDILELSDLLYEYTSGYPFLVSKLCKLIDEEIAGAGIFRERKRRGRRRAFFRGEKYAF